MRPYPLFPSLGFQLFQIDSVNYVASHTQEDESREMQVEKFFKTTGSPYVDGPRSHLDSHLTGKGISQSFSQGYSLSNNFLSLDILF